MNKYIDHVSPHNSAGAVSSFLGTTRDNFEGKTVTSLSYESYNQMAINCMREICVKVSKCAQNIFFYWLQIVMQSFHNF